MAKSILQNKKECYICRRKAERTGYYGPLPERRLERHHFLHGPNRRLAEKDGLWAWVCSDEHHIYGPEAPHANHDVDLELQQIAQRAYESVNSREAWMRRYGKNYLEE